jgi:type II secretory pathway pseudopilin PulG
MIKNIFGYTLIELVMAVSLLVIVLTGGTAIFFRSFRSSGVSDIQTSLNNSLRSLDEMIERSLRYGEVAQVGSHNRADCVTAGVIGVTGSSLTVLDLSGGPALYSLTAGIVSSNSGVQISNPEIEVTKLEFTWYCRSGVNDKMKMLIEANVSGKSGEVVSTYFKKDINLLNSGIN